MFLFFYYNFIVPLLIFKVNNLLLIDMDYISQILTIKTREEDHVNGISYRVFSVSLIGQPYENGND